MSAQHRTKAEPGRFPAGRVFLIIVLLAVIIGGGWFIATRGDLDSDNAKEADPRCPAGDITLTVAEQYPGLGRDALDRIADKLDPIQEHCVTIRAVADVRQAALYLGVDSPATETWLAANGRSKDPSAAPAAIAHRRVGFVTAQPGDPDPASHVVYPTTQDIDAAIAAAAALHDDPAAAIDALNRDRDSDIAAAIADPGLAVILGEDQDHQGQVFTPIPGAELSVQAFPLTMTEQIDDLQNKAAAAVTGAAAAEIPAPQAPDAQLPAPQGIDRGQIYQAFGDVAATPVNPAAPAPEGSIAQEPAAGEDSHAPAEHGSVDTLFLLDASAQMTPRFPEAVVAVADASEALRADGRATSLWNYSSPLSPGVTKPWRNNIPFGSPEPLRPTLEGFGTGGVPQTRTSLIAALQEASDHARATSAPVRLIALTTGTDPSDLGDDQAVIGALRSARDAGVTVALITVGDGPADAALAEESVTIPAGDDIHAAVMRAAGL